MPFQNVSLFQTLPFLLPPFFSFTTLSLVSCFVSPTFGLLVLTSFCCLSLSLSLSIALCPFFTTSVVCFLALQTLFFELTRTVAECRMSSTQQDKHRCKIDAFNWIQVLSTIHVGVFAIHMLFFPLVHANPLFLAGFFSRWICSMPLEFWTDHVNLLSFFYVYIHYTACACRYLLGKYNFFLYNSFFLLIWTESLVGTRIF